MSPSATYVSAILLVENGLSWGAHISVQSGHDADFITRRQGWFKHQKNLPRTTETGTRKVCLPEISVKEFFHKILCITLVLSVVLVISTTVFSTYTYGGKKNQVFSF